MSRPRDLLRSLVRVAADEAKQGFERVSGFDGFRKRVAELVQQRIPIPASALTAAVVHMPGVESASVTVHGGAIHVDVGFENGQFLAGSIVPSRIRFAPRGAKEVSFRIEPPELARGHRMLDVVGAISGVVATTLWPVARLNGTRDQGGAVVERDGVDGFTVDLRTVPAVRALESKGTAALVVEVVELGELLVRDGALVLQLQLPQLGV